jgi:hypothetical protein
MSLGHASVSTMEQGGSQRSSRDEVYCSLMSGLPAGSRDVPLFTTESDRARKYECEVGRACGANL